MSGGGGNDDMSGTTAIDQLWGDKGHDLLNGVDTAEEDKLDGGRRPERLLRGRRRRGGGLRLLTGASLPRDS